MARNRASCCGVLGRADMPAYRRSLRPCIAWCSRPRSSAELLLGALARTERAPALEVGRVDEVPVPLDVAALAADDEQHELLRLGRVRHLARRRRLDVDEAARAELSRLAVDLHAGTAAMDEVELVLDVVEVVESFEAGRHHERV